MGKIRQSTVHEKRRSFSYLKELTGIQGKSVRGLSSEEIVWGYK